jgi:hypothetical protein
VASGIGCVDSGNSSSAWGAQVQAAWACVEQRWGCARNAGGRLSGFVLPRFSLAVSCALKAACIVDPKKSLISRHALPTDGVGANPAPPSRQQYSRILGSIVQRRACRRLTTRRSQTPSPPMTLPLASLSRPSAQTTPLILAASVVSTPARPSTPILVKHL